jgi:hypothetical protein
MGPVDSVPPAAASARNRETMPMAPSAMAMIYRRSNRSAKEPVNSDRTPWGSMPHSMAMESTAGEPVRSVRYQMRAY